MNTQGPFGADLSNIVYVKPVATADLPLEVQKQAEGRETLYAVHNADGEQLALVIESDMAFALARQNDLAPVQVQ